MRLHLGVHTMQEDGTRFEMKNPLLTIKKVVIAAFLIFSLAFNLILYQVIGEMTMMLVVLVFDAGALGALLYFMHKKAVAHWVHIKTDCIENSNFRGRQRFAWGDIERVLLRDRVEVGEKDRSDQPAIPSAAAMRLHIQKESWGVVLTHKGGEEIALFGSLSSDGAALGHVLIDTMESSGIIH